jgi:hypothetical protein
LIAQGGYGEIIAAERAESVESGFLRLCSPLYPAHRRQQKTGVAQFDRPD